jgi:FKBP-type peptidyl-prolyl cis-trans isomerase
LPQKLLSSLAAAGLLLSLVGCGSSGETSSEPECTPTASGSASDAVEVTGGGDDALAATFPQPTSAGDATQRTVVTEGDAEGMVAVDGSTVSASLAVYNGTSGVQIDELTATQDFVLEDPLFAGIQDALRCSVAGDVVAAVIPPAEAFGDQGVPEISLAATDSLVFIAEVTDVTETVSASPSPSSTVEVLPRADGADQPATPGLPTVTLADDGAPTIAIPDAAAPADLQIAVLKQGEGAEVADGATVTVHYTGVVWETGEVFDSSWTRGEPTAFPTDGVIPGFSAALVGQKVGSQVIAVIPPAEGYGDAPPEGSPITATSTLVFVVDILAVQ